MQEIMNKPKNLGGGIDESGHYKCFFCDGDVIHEGMDMAQDVYPDTYNENDVLHYMICSKCGAEYEVVQKENPNDGNVMGEELKLRKQCFKDG